MKSLSKIFFIALLFCAPLTVFAQDNLKLACPFDRGTGREPKEAFTWDPKDEKVIMVSNMDSIARSCVTGTVSNVSQTEDGNYEVVIYYKNYYFWYYGVSKPLVKKGQNVTAREAIAIYKPGSELEFRMFKDEKPMDPRALLECTILKAND
jgi:hypothetical protein